MATTPNIQCGNAVANAEHWVRQRHIDLQRIGALTGGLLMEQVQGTAASQPAARYYASSFETFIMPIYDQRSRMMGTVARYGLDGWVSQTEAQTYEEAPVEDTSSVVEPLVALMEMAA